jgi:hypothetical protein
VPSPREEPRWAPRAPASSRCRPKGTGRPRGRSAPTAPGRAPTAATTTAAAAAAATRSLGQFASFGFVWGRRNFYRRDRFRALGAHNCPATFSLARGAGDRERLTAPAASAAPRTARPSSTSTRWPSTSPSTPSPRSATATCGSVFVRVSNLSYWCTNARRRLRETASPAEGRPNHAYGFPGTTAKGLSHDTISTWAVSSGWCSWCRGLRPPPPRAACSRRVPSGLPPRAASPGTRAPRPGGRFYYCRGVCL